MTKTNPQSSEKLTCLTILDNTNIQTLYPSKGIFSIFSAFPEYDRGNRLSEMGRYESAIPYYEDAVKIKPDWAIGWLKLADTLYKLQKYEQAVEAYKICLSLKPNTHQAWNSYGVILSNLKQYEEAIACFDKGIKINPNNYELWFKNSNT